MEASPSQHSSVLAQAEAYFAQGEFGKSGELFAQLTMPNIDAATRAAALYGLGMICLNEGRDVDAQSCLDESFAINPGNAHSAYYLGVIAARAGDENEAKRWYAQAVATDPGHSAALMALAQISAGSGDRSPHAARMGTGERVDRGNTAVHPQPSPAGDAHHGATTRVGPPHPPVSATSVIGIARGVRQQPVPWRGKPAAMQQLTFRLDAYTRDGDGPTDTYGVELRSHEVRGSITDGDWVEMPANFDPRKPGKVKECLNLTTNERVFTKYRIWGT